jgi:hypothetical protein
MAQHAAITTALSMPVFFCDRHHPWQSGTNKSTNRLLRQYLHKTADLGSLTQDHVNSVAAQLNHRPRRALGWITPAEAFDRVQQTARLASAWPIRSVNRMAASLLGRFASTSFRPSELRPAGTGQSAR